MKVAFLTLALVAFAASIALADATRGTYLGTSQTTVKYLNPNTLQPVATQIFTCNETVIIGAPKKASAVTEQNLFSLTVVATRPTVPPVGGDVKVGSAHIFPSVFGGTVLAQYWSLQNTATGFVGEMDDNHVADGLPTDRVFANLGGPHGTPAGFKFHDGQIAPGLQCTLVATVTGRLMTLKITGYAFVPNQAVIQFTTKIAARR